MCSLRSVKHINAENARSVLSRYTTFLFDCDGVIWDNDMFTRIEGTGNAMRKLRQDNKRTYFMSNNPAFSKAQFQERFRRLGGFEASADEIIGVCDATGAYLKDILNVQGKVFTMGPDTLVSSLREHGLSVSVSPADDILVKDFGSNIHQLQDILLEADIEAVVVSTYGQYTFNDVFRAANYLQNPACHLVVTSRENKFWVGKEDGKRLLPVGGTLISAVEAGSGRQAVTVGKPSRIFFESLKTIHPDIEPSSTVMVGDVLTSDIAFARNCGIDSILVCSGMDNVETLEKAVAENPDTPLPTYILPSVGHLDKWI